MHRNYRRRYLPYEHGPFPSNYDGLPSKRWYKKNFWSRDRTRVRDLIAKEQYNRIQNRYPDGILWEIY